MSAVQKNEEPPKVVVKKVISANCDRVFEAWTKPELMEKWFFPPNWSAKSSNDLRVGGTYSHEMISDGSQSSCTSKENNSSGKPHYGEYLEIDRPNKLVFTWNSPSVQDTRVTVELRAVGESTEVTITHELLTTEESRSGHNAGWGLCLENLSNFFLPVN